VKTITSVPESLTREQYVSLIASVGFDTNDLRRLEFRMDGVYAEVFERGKAGIRLDLQTDEVVLNRVFIPIRDD
jgi:hypothetical protein